MCILPDILQTVIAKVKDAFDALSFERKTPPGRGYDLGMLRFVTVYAILFAVLCTGAL